MKNSSLNPRTITVAQRGHIIQRVIVDGRTSAEVAADFGLPKRLVDVWIADFRRHGMASLRQEPGRNFAAEVIQLAIARPSRVVWRKLAIGLRRLFAIEPIAQQLPLRRSNKDGPL